MRNETDSVTITLMNYFVRDIADKTKPAETIAGKTRTRWNLNTGWGGTQLKGSVKRNLKHVKSQRKYKTCVEICVDLKIPQEKQCLLSFSNIIG